MADSVAQDEVTVAGLVLEVRNLTVAFEGGDPVVKDIGFSIAAGETVAIVGESGSGKSTMVSAVLGLLPKNATISGSISLEGREITNASEKEFRQLRGSTMAYVPQDPMSNLNPVVRVGPQVVEAAAAHRRLSRREGRSIAIDAMERAGLDTAAERFRQYPHQYSGGMRQRALIAMGLVNDPRLLIADEPTSALDVTVQRVILDNLAQLVATTGSSVLFITHDLGLAAERADRVLVMRHGKLVESGPARRVFLEPQALYTKELIAASPLVSAKESDRRVARKPDARALLSLENVTKTYLTRQPGERRPKKFDAVAELSLDLRRGQTLAVVGESGSGKSTAAFIALQLTAPTAGKVRFDGVDMTQPDKRALSDFRRRVQPIFQDPYASLDPMFTVERILDEPLTAFRLGSRKERARRIRELLDQVSLPSTMLTRSPSELSGGQRQRVAIARALAPDPQLIVCDEPVSALDVLVQAQILGVLLEIQKELGLSYLFISHDLGVVKEMAHDVVVMQRGRVVERGTAAEIFERPREEYTRALLAAVPGRALFELVASAEH